MSLGASEWVEIVRIAESMLTDLNGLCHDHLTNGLEPLIRHEEHVLRPYKAESLCAIAPRILRVLWRVYIRKNLPYKAGDRKQLGCTEIRSKVQSYCKLNRLNCRRKSKG